MPPLGPGCFLIAAGAAGGLLVAPRRPPGIPPPDAMWFELDELVFDLYREEEKEVRQVVEDAMKMAIPMKVPIVIEMGTADTWLEAH